MQLNTTYDLGQKVYLMALNRIEAATVTKVEVSAFTLVRGSLANSAQVERYRVQFLSDMRRGVEDTFSVDVLFPSPEALTAKLIADSCGARPTPEAGQKEDR